MPMLHTQPEHRTNAQSTLLRELDANYVDPNMNPRNITYKSGWLNKVSESDHRMSDEEFKQYQS